MELAILGRYSPFPPAGGACPGYLVQHEGFNLLLDCGSGALSRLQEFIALEDLDHVVLSHLHGDHAADLAILKYAADYDVRADKRAARRATAVEDEPTGQGVRVYSPSEPIEEFARIAYKEAVFSHPIVPGRDLVLGPFTLRFAWTQHPIPCVAIRVETSGASLVYTGDTALCDSVVDLARGTDLLLAEASLPEGTGAFRGHMSASEAGRLAREAEVGALLLTHFWPEADIEHAVLAARNTAGVPVAAAVEGRLYRIPL